MYVIEAMAEHDLPEVSRLDRTCFTNPWPLTAFRRELRRHLSTHYVVLRRCASPDRPRDGATISPPRPESSHLMRRLRRSFAARNGDTHDGIVGFAGFWHHYDEAHITTIAVDPDVRGRSFGRALLHHLIEAAVARGAGFVSLEVRVGNQVAIRLYESYGFHITGVRPRYYLDDGEDAYVMWLDEIRSDAYLQQLAAWRADLQARLGGALVLPVALTDEPEPFAAAVERAS